MIGGASIEAWGIRPTLFIAIAGGLTLAGTAIALTPALRKAR